MGLLDTGGASDTGSAATFTGVLVTLGNAAFALGALVIGGGHLSFGWRPFWFPLVGAWCGSAETISPSGRRSRRLGSSQRLLDAVEHHRRLRLGGVALRRAQQLHHNQLCRARRRNGVDFAGISSSSVRRILRAAVQRQSGAWRRSWSANRSSISGTAHSYRLGYLSPALPAYCGAVTSCLRSGRRIRRSWETSPWPLAYSPPERYWLPQRVGRQS